MNMALTIPKKLAEKGDLVVIPRAEYESLQARAVKEFKPTKKIMGALVRARKNMKAGKALSYEDVRRELELDR